MSPSFEELARLVDLAVNTKTAQLEDYERICLILSNLNRSQLLQAYQANDIMGVLMSIDLQHKSFIQIALKLASIIFSLIPLIDFVQSHEQELLLVLASTKYELIEFILGRLEIGVGEYTRSATQFPNSILASVFKLLVHDKLSISKSAQCLLKAIATQMPDGINRIFANSISSNLLELCSKPDHYLRVCEMAVDLINLVPSQLGIIQNAGLLTPIVDGLKSRDPLVCLNWLELSKQLALVEEGYLFLERNDIFGRLLADLDRLKSDPLASLLLPGYIGFFGSLAKHDPSRWLTTENNASNFLDTLSEATNDSNSNISMVAFGSIGQIASSMKGRAILDKLFKVPEKLSEVLPKIGELTRDAPTEICVRIIQCLACLIRRPFISDLEDLIHDASMTLDWAIEISRNLDLNSSATTKDSIQTANSLAKRIYALASQPFYDIRIASLKAIESLSTQPWGVSLLFNQPGFMEYLLNRRTELGFSEKVQLLQAKMDIVGTILNTCQAYTDCKTNDYCNLISKADSSRLKLYLKEGLWGMIQAEAAVALEPG